MFKKLISVLLAVMMVVSVMAVAVVATRAADLESTKIYFDAGDWAVAKKKVQFYIYSLEKGELLPFGGKATNGTKVSGSETLWEYDPAAKGITFNEGESYAVIFVNANGGAETYGLLLDESCFGHVAQRTGVEYENPVSSDKTSVAAFWDDGIDPAAYGPILQISSLGNVIGTCIP